MLPCNSTNATRASTARYIEGRIFRKNKRKEYLVLYIKEQDTPETQSIPIHLDRRHELPAYLFFLDAVVGVHAVFQNQEWHILHDSNTTSSNMTLIQCAPDPNAVQIVLEAISSKVLPLSVVMPHQRHEKDTMTDEKLTVTLLDDEEIPMRSRKKRPPRMIGVEGATEEGPIPITLERAHEIVSMPPGRKKRSAIAEIVRTLQGKRAQKVGSTQPPYLKKHDLELLDKIEQLGTGTSSNDSYRLQSPLEIKEVSESKIPLNLFCNNEDELLELSEEVSRRKRYLVAKKQPQIKWLLNRIREVQRPDLAPIHFLDVGGGRGDLAVSICLQFPNATITVVDKNESSLEAARAFATACDCSGRMHFVLADFAVFVREYHVSTALQNPIDFVIALHACGDLSDLALTFAESIHAPFIICPCCYTKRYVENFEPPWCREANCTDEQITENDSVANVLGRLAELNERPDISYRAMRVINSMRLHHVSRNQYSLLRVEEYDSSRSGRNLVLVGI